MFVLGHVGITVRAAHIVDRRVDLRAAALLAVIPDLLDKPVALLFPSIVNENTRGFGHTFLASLLVLAVLAAFRRRFGPVLLLWACYLGHFALDRMWMHDNPKVFFWPLLGSFPPALHGLANGPLFLWNVYGEIIGGVLLLDLVLRRHLYRRKEFAAFWATGRLP
jgi:hypothetical protein